MFKYFCFILISIQLICNVRTNDESNDLVFVKDVDDEQTTSEEFKSNFPVKKLPTVSFIIII